MNIVILIRQTDDYEKWSNMKLEDIPFNHRVIKEVKSKFLQYVTNWNNKYSLNYYKFRARLKEIGQRNLKDTGLPVIYEDPKVFFESNRGNKNLLIIPTDDDDWLHPNIGDELNSFCKFNYLKSDIIVWRNRLCNYWMKDNAIRTAFTEYHDLVATNSYAVRMGGKARLIDLLAHWEIRRENNVFIDRSYSIWVRHPASLCSIKQNQFGVSPPKMAVPKEIPEDLMWAKEYVKMLIKLKEDFNSSTNCVDNLKLL